MLLILSLTACGPGKTQQLSKKAKLLERLNETYIPPANAENLKQNIERFRADNAGQDSACNHVNYQLLRLALENQKVELLENDYNRKFDVGVDCMQNSIGILRGSDGNLKEEYIVLAISYADMPSNKSAVNVAAMLEMVRILKLVDFNRRSVLIAYLDGEGSGVDGARFLAKAIKRNNIDAAAVLYINLDEGALKTDQMVVTGMYNSDIPTTMDRAIRDFSIEDATYVDNRALFHSYETREFQQVLGKPSHTLATNVYDGKQNTAEAVIAETTVFIDRILPGILALCKGAEIEVPE